MTSENEKNEMKIRIRTSDNETVGYYDLATIKVSGSLKILLDLYGEEDDELKQEGLLADRKLSVVSKVFEWMEHYKDQPVEPVKRGPLNDYEEEEQQRTDNISKWDQQFLDVERGTLFDIIEAANFFDVQSLFLAGCKTVAHKMIKGKTREEMMAALGFECDLSSEEVKHIKNQIKWFVEK